MNIITEARKTRKAIEEMAASATVSNRTAFEGRFLFANLEKQNDFWDGHLIRTGERIRWRDKLMNAANDLWAYPESNPDNAPNLWELIEYKNGYRVLTGPITVYNLVQPGERCWENDVLYEYTAPAATTYRPSEYALYWEVVQE